MSDRNKYLALNFVNWSKVFLSKWVLRNRDLHGSKSEINLTFTSTKLKFVSTFTQKTLFALLLISVLTFGQKRKVLFIIADGIPADVIEKVPTPNLDSISKIGAYERIYVGGDQGTFNETPTISAVGYNSLLTGTWANKHNVWDNYNQMPDYHYYTIFRFFKEQYPKGTTAVFSSWEDNRTVLVGEGLPQTGSLKLTYHFDGLEKDTINYPHDPQRDFMHRIDESVSTQAAKTVRENAPDLSWVYLEYTDDMGHMYGDSPQFYKAVEYMDEQVGRIWQAIQYRENKFHEKWSIWITTDHGRTASDGKGHGGQSERERTTWLVTNEKDLNAYAKSGQAAIVDIMPSIADDLGLKIPKDHLWEIDGVPLNKKISLSEPRLTKVGNELHLSWKPWENKGKVKIYLTTTNYFKTGGKDVYQLMKTVPLKNGQAVLQVNKLPADFYKVVLEGKNNTVNTWWINPVKQ